MKQLAITALLFGISYTATAQTAYFPPAGQWLQASPQTLGVNERLLQQAVDYAVASENTASKEQAIVQATTFGAREPFDQIIGPMSVRASANGIIIYQGKVIAHWGDTDSVDMTHSISKSFLTTVTGLAIQDGLIKDAQDLVYPYLPKEQQLFTGEHNRKIRWDHLLRQTSDWQGSLWGKPDWADRPEGEPKNWPQRPLYEPGTRYKYNDVRTNVLALATTYVWRKPLPQVLHQRIMQPIGAGRNVIYIDKQHDVVMVARWLANGDELNTLIEKLLAALPAHQT